MTPNISFSESFISLENQLQATLETSAGTLSGHTVSTLNSHEASFSSLPEEILSHFMTFVSVEAFSKLECTSTLFKRLIESNKLWANLFARDFDDLKLESALSAKIDYQIKYLTEKNWSLNKHAYTLLKSPHHTINKHKFITTQNFVVVESQQPDSLDIWDKSNKTFICSIEALPKWHDGSIILGQSKDKVSIYDTCGIGGTVNILDLSKGQCISDFSCGWRHLLANDRFLYQSDSDSQIEVFDACSSTSLFKLEDSEGFPGPFYADGENQILAWNPKKAIQSWDLSSGKLVDSYKISDYDFSVIDLNVNQTHITLTDSAGSLRVMERKSGDWVFYLPKVKSFCWSGRDIVILDKENRLKVLNTKKMRLEAEFNEQTYPSAIKIKKILATRRHVIITTEEEISIWDKKAGSCLHKIPTPVRSITLDNDSLIATNHEGIHIWDFAHYLNS